jgi:nucleotide-binding universal stress UspA family protein
MPTGPFHRILVGWDCSPGAAAALRAAAAIAGNDSVRVVALAVLKPAPHTESSDEGAADLAGRRRFAEETFAKAREGLDGASRARVSLRYAESADPARAVCEYAEEHAFDLMVLGRHGTGGVLHPRLGHVAETAVKKSRVPVLLMGDRP